MRVTSTSPGGMRSFSLSAEGIEPLLEQRADLVGDRLADAGQLLDACPARAISATEAPESRMFLAAVR